MLCGHKCLQKVVQYVLCGETFNVWDKINYSDCKQFTTNRRLGPDFRCLHWKPQNIVYCPKRLIHCQTIANGLRDRLHVGMTR